MTDNGGISAVTKTIYICSPVGSPPRRRMLMSAQDMNLGVSCFCGLLLRLRVRAARLAQAAHRLGAGRGEYGASRGRPRDPK
ncbi:MAG: hypothetical protein ACPIOQ_60050 [Promethearchaeia archaeon]